MMLTTEKISEMLKVHPETVRGWIRDKKLKATKEGKSYKVDEIDFKNFMMVYKKEKGTSISKLEFLFDAIHGQSTKIKDLASFLGLEGGIINGDLKLRLPLEEEEPWELTPGNLEKYIYIKERQIKINEHNYNMKLQEIEWEKVKAEGEYKGRNMEIEKEIAELKLKRQQLLDGQI